MPTAFEMRAVLDVAAREGGLGGLVLVPRALPAAYVKDYDADPASGPLGRPARFGVARRA